LISFVWLMLSRSMLVTVCSAASPI